MMPMPIKRTSIPCHSILRDLRDCVCAEFIKNNILSPL